MFITLLKSKIQELEVTESSIDYPGSISLPKTLMDAAGIRQFELVHVNNKSNGNRIQTYAVVSSAKGRVTVNGAASKLFRKGDKIHVTCFSIFPEDSDHCPLLVISNSKNQLISAKPYIFNH